MEHHKFEGEIENITPGQLEFIKNVIEQEGYQESKVTFEAVGKTGENYVANVKRIVIEGENGNLSMIVKLAPTNEMVRKNLKIPLMFRNEHLMYTEVLPNFVSLQKQAEVPEEDLLKFPRCYGTNVEAPNEVVMLEDLKDSGFGIVDRFVPLSNECVTSVLRNLAIYHSLSYVLKSKEPDTYNYYKDNLGDTWGAVADEIPEEVANLKTLEIVSLNVLDNPEHQNVMRNKLSELVTRAAKMSKLENGSRYAVIQHGDCWSNNIMLKFEEESLKQSILIDYQVCKNFSPANDILFLIFNCTEHETRVKCFYDWIEYYHSELDKSLSNYGLKANYVYPRDQLDADLKRYGKLVLGCFIFFSGIFILKLEEAGKLKESFASAEVDAAAGTTGDVHDDTRSFIKKRLTGLIESFITFGLL